MGQGKTSSTNEVKCELANINVESKAKVQLRRCALIAGEGKKWNTSVPQWREKFNWEESSGRQYSEIKTDG